MVRKKKQSAPATQGKRPAKVKLWQHLNRCIDLEAVESINLRRFCERIQGAITSKGPQILVNFRAWKNNT
jgi:hypothetical protein